MPKFFVKTNQIKENQIEIINDDVNHIKNVLRKKIDDNIEICDSETSINYDCKIKEMNDKKIICDILNMYRTEKEKTAQIDIFQGLPKADKMELVIQKSVELGVNKIIPVALKRCIVKIDKKDEIKKVQRWQKISEVAAKQCGRNTIPEIQNISKLENICNILPKYDIILIAYENEKENTLKNEIKQLKKADKKDYKIGVLIGPEGGLEQDEVEVLKQNGAKIVTLGKRILRTETVALNVLSILMYELED